MQRLIALSLGFAGLILATHASQGQTALRQCGARGQILAVLADHYKETRRGIGLAGPQSVVELFASDSSGSWTITVTLPDGRTCLLISGQGWDPAVDPLPVPGRPA